MKKLLIAICAILCAVVAQAQEHMTFKGVPMDCNLATYVAKLEAKGYKTVYTDETGSVLTGSFAGKDDCEIYVISTGVSKLVWTVVVYFPEETSWSSLKSEYNSFKQSYTGKYGVPESYEFFSSPYYEGDGYELQALGVEKCTFASYFTTTSGNITLRIGKKGQVQVAYEDAINVEIWKAEKAQIVTNDI